MKRLSLVLVLLLATTVVADELAKPGSFWLWDFIVWLISPVVLLLFQGILALMRWNPRVFCLPDEIRHGCTVTGGIDKMMPYFLDMLVPLYIVALMFTAMYFLVKGGGPRGRARAKAMLSKLLYSMVLVGIAPIIYQIMLDISSAFTEWIFSQGFVDLNKLSSETFVGSAGLCCVFILALLVLVLTAIVAAVRYMFVIIFAVLFPFLLFLYFFDLTRSFGRKWLRRTVTWIFTPVIQAMFLVFTVVALQSIAPMFGPTGFTFIGQLASFFLALVGMLMVGATPLIMEKIYGFVGGGISAYGLATNTPWIAGMGALIEGRGENAVELTKTVMSRANYTTYALSLAQSGAARSFGPSAPVPTFGATGESGMSRGGAEKGGMSKGEAADAAAADVKAMDARGGGPIMARGRESDRTALAEDEPSRFSVGSHPVYSYDLERESLKKRSMGVSPLIDEKRLGQKIEEAEKVAEGLTTLEGGVELQRGEVITAKEEKRAEIPRRRADEVVERARLLREGDAEELRAIREEESEELQMEKKREVKRWGKKKKRR